MCDWEAANENSFRPPKEFYGIFLDFSKNVTESIGSSKLARVLCKPLHTRPLVRESRNGSVQTGETRCTHIHRNLKYIYTHWQHLQKEEGLSPGAASDKGHRDSAIGRTAFSIGSLFGFGCRLSLAGFCQPLPFGFSLGGVVRLAIPAHFRPPADRSQAIRWAGSLQLWPALLPRPRIDARCFALRSVSKAHIFPARP